MVAGVLVLMFPEGWPRAWHGSGVLPVAVFHANSWSCLWEPKIWSPGNPGGIFGRTAQLSSLFCGWGSFWVGPLTFVGCRASTFWCMGARSLVAVGVACIDLLSFVQQLQNNSQQFKFARHFCFYFVSWIGDNLPINCCMTILLLNDLQNWRSFVEKIGEL